MGAWRSSSPTDDDLGLEPGNGRQDDDPDTDGGRHSRQTGAARACARAVHRSRRSAKGDDRSRLFLSQRDVGKESPPVVQGVARMAREGDRQRRQGRHSQVGLLSVVIAKGSSVRRPDFPIDSLFVDRWSPRAMSGEAIDEADLRVLFEAARWAPSAGNTHPWRILYARRDTEHWPVFFDLLVERNKVWCVRAA